MPSFKRSPIATAVLMLFAAPHGALAQAGPEAVLPEVQVSGEAPPAYRSDAPASRTGTPLRDVPQTITVVPKELMQAQGVTTLQEALRNVPAITFFAGEGGQMGDGPRLRGFDSRGSIFIDGVRDKGEYFRDVFNLESIEVLKGSSSLLFGRGTAGGVINQVTKTPGPEPRREAALTLGSEAFKRATADLNVPLGERSAFRLNAMAQDNESFRDHVEGEAVGLAPSLRLGIGADTDLTLSYQYLETSAVPDYGIVHLFGRPADVPISNFYGFPTRDYDDLDTSIASVRLEHRVSDALSLRNTLMWARYERDNELTAPRLIGTPAPGTPLSSIRVRRNDRKSRLEDNGSLINQTEVTWRAVTGGVRHRLLAGVEVGREDIDRTTFAFPGLTETSHDVDLLHPDSAAEGPTFDKTPRQFLESEADSLALYLQDEAELTPQWKLVGGLRWDRYEVSQTTDTRIASSSTPAGLARLERTDKVTSGRGGVIWQPDQAQSYYVSYGTSFNPSAEFGTLSAAAVDVEPEEVRTLELGGKWEVGPSLSLTAALFRNEKTNERIDDPAGGPEEVLLGARRVDGFEVGLAGRLARRWDLFAGVALMDGEITEQPAPPGELSNEGNQPSFVPESSASVWTTYRLDGGWDVGGGFLMAGSYFANDANDSRVPGYMRWDASVGYFHGPYELRLNVQNLFDTEYYASSHSRHVMPGAPRTLLATVRYQF